MERIARIRRHLYATLPVGYRIRVALKDLLAGSQESWFRSAINTAIGKEFTKAGIVFDADLDFFEIIHKAVLRRVAPNDPDYDDFFQDVAMGLLDRDGVTKDWVQDIVKMQKGGLVTNLKGWLATVAQRYVQDLARKSALRGKREVGIQAPGDEEGPGIDPDHYDSSPSHESDVSAQELYKSLMRELKDDRSKQILDIIIDNGVRGFLKGKGLSDVARAMGVKPSTATYYRDTIFKPDLQKALKRLGDQDLLETAQAIFASVRPPVTALLCEELRVLASAE